MTKTTPLLAICLIGLAAPLSAQDAASDDANLKADHQEAGRWMTADGVPTYKIEEDGTVDWATFSGFRRYHSECHVCHGPDGEGSTYAPPLKKSALALDYYDFIEIVASGRQKVGASQNSVMPALGTNPNVYLKARGANAVDRGRPAKKVAKSDEFAAAEASCME
jgi:methanol metabolism-related c-type cytochrome